MGRRWRGEVSVFKMQQTCQIELDVNSSWDSRCGTSRNTINTWLICKFLKAYLFLLSLYGQSHVLCRTSIYLQIKTRDRVLDLVISMVQVPVQHGTSIACLSHSPFIFC